MIVISYDFGFGPAVFANLKAVLSGGSERFIARKGCR